MNRFNFDFAADMAGYNNTTETKTEEETKAIRKENIARAKAGVVRDPEPVYEGEELRINLNVSDPDINDAAVLCADKAVSSWLQNEDNYQVNTDDDFDRNPSLLVISFNESAGYGNDLEHVRDIAEGLLEVAQLDPVHIGGRAVTNEIQSVEDTGGHCYHITLATRFK